MVTSEAPPFWWEKPDWRAWMLTPFSALYGLVAARRMASARREKMAAPVLCVGNFTVGGAGKTPAAIALADAAREAGRKPGILSRGHGGSLSGPHLVDLEHDGARHVGDEPMLLARAAPVAVTPDRAAGARLLIDQGCDFLIMDDGFQSARIHIDHALVVVDGRRGLGNGYTLPAGPMRAPLHAQMRHADALLVVGEGEAASTAIRQAARAGKPVHHASVRTRNGAEVAGRRVLAFAGIGEPAKFFDTVAKAGGELAKTRAFGDHHAFSDADIRELESEADRAGLVPVTTAKDAVRMSTGSSAAREFARRLTVIEIGLVFEPEDAPERIIAATLAAHEARRHGVSRS